MSKSVNIHIAMVLLCLVMVSCQASSGENSPFLNLNGGGKMKPYRPLTPNSESNPPGSDEKGLEMIGCLMNLLRLTSGGGIIAKSIQERQSPSEADVGRLKKMLNVSSSCDSMSEKYGINIKKCLNGLLEVFLWSMKKISSGKTTVEDATQAWASFNEENSKFCLTEEFKKIKPDCFKLIEKTAIEVGFKFTELSHNKSNQGEVISKVKEIVNYGMIAQLTLVCL